MSGDPQSNSQLSQVGSKDLKQEVLIQLQALYYRGSSNGSKKSQDALKRILRHAKHSQSQSETRMKKQQEEERGHMCQPIQAPLYHDAPDYDIPCNVFAMQNV